MSRLPHRPFRYKDVRYASTAFVADQASAGVELGPDRIVVIAPDANPKLVRLLCPCGCGAVVTVSVRRGMGRAWKLNVTPDGRVSLSPSVWLDVGCCSHFILRHNVARLLYGRVPEMSPDELEDWWRGTR